ncbi:MAG: Fic family protein [Candidatus Margulisbacteria bacterium]|nr:Fic family protein [Candidatus Margulisiibacteriota bacterium]
MDAPILPSIEKELKLEALISRTHHSTSIEGNRLSKEEVAIIVSGGKLEARPKDKKEVLNYIAALKFVDKYGPSIKQMTPAVVLKLHGLITKGILSARQSGNFRDKMVYVIDSFGRTVFTPPKDNEVPHLVKDLCAWLNSKEAMGFYPVLTAGIAHYEFVRIHPFIDGNGRVGRALATLILYKLNFDIKDFFTLDDYYNEDRASYYAALQSVDPESIDITQWLEYFVEGVMVQINRIKKEVYELSVDKHLKEKIGGQKRLSGRQIEAFKCVRRHGKITVGELAALTKVVTRTALRDLNKMREMGILKLIGKTGRSAYYELA